MGNSIPWIIISVAFLILLFLVIFIIFRRKKKHKPDYYTFFVVGIIWTIFGIISRENPLFFIMGLVFMAIGLTHKKDWKKNHKTWKQLDKDEQKLKMWLIIGLAVFVILGVIFLLLNNGGVL